MNNQIWIAQNQIERGHWKIWKTTASKPISNHKWTYVIGKLISPLLNQLGLEAYIQEATPYTLLQRDPHEKRHCSHLIAQETTDT